MSVAPLCTKTSWAALRRPPIAPASAGAQKPVRLADSCQMGGRVEPVHGEMVNGFNHIKYFLQTVFLFQKSFLYWPNGLWHAHAPDFSRHHGGAFACAARRRASKKFSETDEQFYCRSSAGTEPRQPQGRRRPATQSQCHATWQAFGRPSRPLRPSRQSQIDHPQFGRALHADESTAQSAPGVSP